MRDDSSEESFIKTFEFCTRVRTTTGRVGSSLLPLSMLIANGSARGNSGADGMT